MNKPINIKMTIEVTYTANPKDYMGANTPEEMAEVDRKSFENLDAIIQLLEVEGYKLTVVPLK
jgi:hypothetical protein